MNIGGPSPDYMALLHQTLSGGPAPTGPVMLGAPPAPPPSPEFAAQPGQNMSPMPAPAPAMSQAPAPPPAAVPAPPPGPMPYIRQISAGGMVPAREVDMRGPSFMAAQNERNAAMDAAVQTVNERAQQTAAGDYAVALEQERLAGIQKEAADYSAAQRAEELAQRQADFDASAKAMGDAGTLDPSRFFANASTGSKLAMMVSLLVGGLAEAKGARNTGAEAIRRIADQDLKAQEFAYYAARDQATAKQTAFGMAMQKYQNADAARAAARAATMDVIQAQLAKQSALWKGTEAQNRATMASAQLADERMQQIAQGVRFMPASYAGPQYIDTRTGLPYSQAEVKGMQAQADTRAATQEDKANEAARDVAGKVMVEGVKAGAEQAKDERALQVALPNGDVVKARNSTEVAKLTGLASAVDQARALVDEAKTIRSRKAWMVPGTEDAQRLSAIQSELTLSFKDRGGLGALSGPDMDLALGATGDITSMKPNATARLDSFAKHTDNALRSYVRTIPGAPGTAKGQMPASFTAYGKK